MHQDRTSQDNSPTFAAYVPGRFQTLIWSSLDASLYRSAVFYAERYFSLDRSNHDARHLYATSLLRCEQVHSALHLVNSSAEKQCLDCAMIKAECYTALGRHNQAGEILEKSVLDPAYSALDMKGFTRVTRQFDDNMSLLLCRTGKAAMKSNLRDKAVHYFRRALTVNPMLWEAFEGLCAVGSFPEIEELFPSRSPPVKQGPEDPLVNIASSSRPAQASGPVASGTGFFSPNPSTHSTFHGWRPDPGPHQPFRMGGPRDSLITNESFSQLDNSMLGAHLPTRAAAIDIIHPSRPLSSADETGPAAKKPRSLSRHTVTDEKSRPDLRSRKQPIATSKASRNESSITAAPSMASRRSARLLFGGTGEKQKSHVVKHPPQRDRKRPANHGRSRSTESEMDDDYAAFGDVAYSPSPPSIAQSPRSEGSPVPLWTAAQEQAAQEAYDIALADNYIYDLMRLFASSVRSLAMYDCNGCLEELDQLPDAYQRSSSVMAMSGRARYEMADYIKAERFFNAARTLEPCRLWDMEELLSIDSRSPQAWIAVGNCFSLQKERSQALTCFRRAAQLDTSCAYAYTLSGHESIDEDLDKAINFFQSALRADPRHYNAWYGLGTCYLRMSKIRLAEYHFRKAAAIHPTNAVLLGCVGMAVERRGGLEEALGLFNQAVRLSTDNALVRYRRAKILIILQDYRAAIKDLEHLRDSSPEEANVVFQLARVYRLVGDEVKAAQMLAVARDMSPKNLNKIKRLLATEEDEDEMDEG